MKVRIVSGGDVEGHAPSRALARQLRAAGNEVQLDGYAEVRLRDRLLGGDGLVVPATRGDLELAVSLAGRRGLVTAPVPWGLDPTQDIAWRAPGDLALSSSPIGRGLATHLRPAAEAGAGRSPQPGRHAGRSLAIVARWSAMTPARYIAAAAERAGIAVTRLDGLSWGQVPTDAFAVLVVESPQPVAPVTGRRRGEIPVLLWAHHGEHHTDTQLRVLRHVGADAVLLAHSWHLAHRFPRPVHRFPFGLPSSLVTRGVPFLQRPIDVAFVGSGLDGAGAYWRRGAILSSLRGAVAPDRFVAEGGQPPERVAELYGRARLVPNDCGTRHRPITMRVLEAVGAGAVLLTEDAPGLDRLLDPDQHHVVLQDPVGDQALRLLSEPAALAGRAAAASDHAAAHHTTDHRVDELIEIAAATSPLPEPDARDAVDDPLLQPVADDLLLDDVLPLGVHDAEDQLDDRVVWPESRLDRLVDRPLAHATVVHADWAGDPGAAARAARRLVVTHRSRTDVIDAALGSNPAAVIRSETDDVVAVDLGVPGYRIGPAT